MRTVIFFVLVVVLGLVFGVLLEKLCHAVITGQLLLMLTKNHYIGINPLGVSFSVCGVIGIICSYLVIAKFVKK